MMSNQSSQRPFSQRQLRVGELVKQNLGELFIRNEAKIPSINSKLITVTEEAGLSYLGRLLNALGTIGVLSPLMGLLGTVTGMIKTFKQIT